MIEGITEGRETMRIVPNVGPEAMARVRRAQALNDDIDWTVDDEDERRALAMWRPLARAYPEDLAILHGYVLALARVAGEERTVALAGEYRQAAMRLLAKDPVRRDAAAFAASATARWAAIVGDAAAWQEALGLHELEFARSTSDAERAYALHDQAWVLCALGRREEATAKTDAALALDPRTAHMRFDHRHEWDR